MIPSSTPVLLDGIAGITDRYRGFLIDLWGVVHDGQRAYPHAIAALGALRRQGMKICLLSNAPRRAAEAATMLTRMGIDPALYDLIVTSGELVFQSLLAPCDAWHVALGKHYLHIGPPVHGVLFDGLHQQRADAPERADFVVNTGTDERVSAEDLTAQFVRCASFNLPMICANPDLVVHVGDKIVRCAGSIAQEYEAMGGFVQYWGKPHRAVYEHCIARLDLAPASLIAIGDSLRTDIAGARAAGIASAFVADGIHRDALQIAQGEMPAMEALLSLLLREGVTPDFVISAFRW